MAGTNNKPGHDESECQGISSGYPPLSFVNLNIG
jgi:hypothetical protein